MRCPAEGLGRWGWDGTSGGLFSVYIVAWGQGLCQAPAKAWSVMADIRDSLMQALASYVCYPHSLRAVERIPEDQ